LMDAHGIPNVQALRGSATRSGSQSRPPVTERVAAAS
jgi:hypothetical protein